MEWGSRVSIDWRAACGEGPRQKFFLKNARASLGERSRPPEPRSGVHAPGRRASPERPSASTQNCAGSNRSQCGRHAARAAPARRKKTTLLAANPLLQSICAEVGRETTARHGAQSASTPPPSARAEGGRNRGPAARGPRIAYHLVKERVRRPLLRLRACYGGSTGRGPPPSGARTKGRGAQPAERPKLPSAISGQRSATPIANVSTLPEP